MKFKQHGIRCKHSSAYYLATHANTWNKTRPSGFRCLLGADIQANHKYHALYVLDFNVSVHIQFYCAVLPYIFACFWNKTLYWW